MDYTSSTPESCRLAIDRLICLIARMNLPARICPIGSSCPMLSDCPMEARCELHMGKDVRELPCLAVLLAARPDAVENTL